MDVIINKSCTPSNPDDNTGLQDARTFVNEFLNKDPTVLTDREMILRDYASNLIEGTWTEAKCKLSDTLPKSTAKRPCRKRFGKKGPLPESRKNNRKTRNYQKFKITQDDGDYNPTLNVKKIIDGTIMASCSRETRREPKQGK